MNAHESDLYRVTASKRLPPWHGAMILLVAIGSLCAFSVIHPTTAADPNAKPIQVTIDYGDGAEKRFVDLPLQPDMTVLDALRAAKEHPHGITFVVQGTGQNALVMQIDDVKNEGGGEKAKNWMFRVNGKEAERGAGVFTLSGGDAVLWRFAVYEYNSADK